MRLALNWIRQVCLTSSILSPAFLICIELRRPPLTKLGDLPPVWTVPYTGLTASGRYAYLQSAWLGAQRPGR